MLIEIQKALLVIDNNDSELFKLTGVSYIIVVYLSIVVLMVVCVSLYIILNHKSIREINSSSIMLKVINNRKICSIVFITNFSIIITLIVYCLLKLTGFYYKELIGYLPSLIHYSSFIVFFNYLIANRIFDSTDLKKDFILFIIVRVTITIVCFIVVSLEVNLLFIYLLGIPVIVLWLSYKMYNAEDIIEFLSAIILRIMFVISLYIILYDVITLYYIIFPVKISFCDGPSEFNNFYAITKKYIAELNSILGTFNLHNISIGEQLFFGEDFIKFCMNNDISNEQVNSILDRNGYGKNFDYTYLHNYNKSFVYGGVYYNTNEIIEKLNDFNKTIKVIDKNDMIKQKYFIHQYQLLRYKSMPDMFNSLTLNPLWKDDMNFSIDFSNNQWVQEYNTLNKAYKYIHDKTLGNNLQKLENKQAYEHWHKRQIHSKMYCKFNLLVQDKYNCSEFKLENIFDNNIFNDELICDLYYVQLQILELNFVKTFMASNNIDINTLGKKELFSKLEESFILCRKIYKHLYDNHEYINNLRFWSSYNTKQALDEKYGKVLEALANRYDWYDNVGKYNCFQMFFF
jgi:hypothetical protein